MRTCLRHRLGYGSAPAFTLLELLVVVGVVAVLLGVALPVLRNTRLRMREAAVLSHQRQSGLELQIYLYDHNGVFPYGGTPGTARVAYPIIDGPYKGEVNDHDSFYWIQMYVWAYLAIVEGCAMDAPFTGPEIPDRARRVPGSTVSVDWMTSAAFAAPSYFRAGVEQRVVDLAPQRIQTTAYPSSKGILLRHNYLARDAMGEAEIQARGWTVPSFIWFADGHGAMHAPAAMRQPFSGLPGHVTPGTGTPVLVTDDGLRGRDIP